MLPSGSSGPPTVVLGTGVPDNLATIAATVPLGTQFIDTPCGHDATCEFNYASGTLLSRSGNSCSNQVTISRAPYDDITQVSSSINFWYILGDDGPPSRDEGDDGDQLRRAVRGAVLEFGLTRVASGPIRCPASAGASVQFLIATGFRAYAVTSVVSGLGGRAGDIAGEVSRFTFLLDSLDFHSGCWRDPGALSLERPEAGYGLSLCVCLLQTFAGPGNITVQGYSRVFW